MWKLKEICVMKECTEVEKQIIRAQVAKCFLDMQIDEDPKYSIKDKGHFLSYFNVLSSTADLRSYIHK